MYMELSSDTPATVKKIKPVAVPVGLKVVIGDRRIGNRQCLDYNQSHKTQ
jgi:hypothetical protein